MTANNRFMNFWANNPVLFILLGICLVWTAVRFLPLTILFLWCLLWYPCEDRTSLRHLPSYFFILMVWCIIWISWSARPHIFGTYAFLVPTTLITSIMLSAMLSVPPPSPNYTHNGVDVDDNSPLREREQ